MITTVCLTTRSRHPAAARAAGRRWAACLPALALALGSAQGRAADTGTGAATEAEADVPANVPPPPPPTASRWFDFTRLPVIPVPLIDVDPDSGVTVGILPTWLHSNDQSEITRIIAPDLVHSPNFGVGGHFRIFSYPSADEQWSVVAGIKQRVEREFDLEYELGRQRESQWSISTSLVYDRSGTPRFYGLGNRARKDDETNYTAGQEVAQTQAGYNFNHTWQLQYTLRAKHMDVTAGTLTEVPTIQQLFPALRGLGETDQVLNRFSLIYDTRDDATIPSRGTKWVVYAGVASHGEFPFNSMYSEAGFDARTFLPLTPDDTLAGHVALRYLPTADNVPFWALSSIGGGESDIGGQQPLRGYGQGRYYDRDSFAGSLELRHKATTFDFDATRLEIQVTPFVDFGRVFDRTGTNPFSGLHTVAGVGFRGIARPSVVGYVDIGYGSEGTAVFTGINYPF